MACEQPKTHLHAYLDGELDASGMAAFEQHLGTCADCAAALAAEEALRRSLRQAELYERAPESLRRKVRVATAALPARTSAHPGAWRWLAVAAALIIALLGGSRLFSPAIKSPQQAAWTTTLLDAHLRSLQPGHLTDVESRDQHTVKPWFDGKLDIAPPVRDFATDGFPLLGGRLDVIEGRTVAALVYGRRKHIVNVFVWKSQDSVPYSDSGERQGYRWVSWEKDGFTFCAVSDTSLADLQQLKTLFLQY
jgi:mycothiol system anti-sigma-R factor